MDEEEVIIRLKPLTYSVDAVFHLFNAGETTTQWIGFPKRAVGRKPGPQGGVLDFSRFEVWVNAEKIPFPEEHDLIKSEQESLKGLPPPRKKHSSWLMGQAVFRGGESTRIRVSYEARYDSCGLTCREAAYIYGTGAYWKGGIGKASFIVDSTEKGDVATIEAVFSSTETSRHLIRRRLVSQNVERYEIKDFEPNPDGGLSIKVSEKAADKDSTYALHHAARNGHLEQVQELLKQGANVNAMDALLNTPLMAAASGGHLQVAELLVENGADVNAKTSDGRTALKNALANARLGGGQLEVARWLRDNGAKPTNLAVAAFVGHMETVQRLIMAEGIKVNTKNTLNDPAPLTAAAMGGQAEVVKLLLSKGFSIGERNEQGQTALMTAAAAGHADVVKLLLDRGADINARDAHRRSALNHAVFLRGHLEVVRVLVDRGTDINARDDPADRTILMHAAQSGHLELVKLLLEKGAQVNARDGNGETALSLARGKDIEEIEKLLKAHGAKK
ncbi:MAG: ankyrin repeat domain-containing protein [Deltaproteobacteria bacterium]|nr:ankyrin repeat domain-containing protein [Deltaproteobacteria bacterium]